MSGDGAQGLDVAVDPADFLARVVRREGGLAETNASGALECVLPPELRADTGLSEAPVLRLLAPAQDGETGLALESHALRACIDRVLARGRRASVRLAAPSASKHASLASALPERFGALNGTLRARGTRTVPLELELLEFRYEAVGEERQEGSVFVACERSLGLASVPLGQELLRRIAFAEPREDAPSETAVAESAALVARHARRVLEARLEPLRERLSVRMRRDAQRIAEYYDTLSSEATRRRRAAKGLAASMEKLTAIRSQRDEKLRELAFRYAVEVRTEIASALAVGCIAPACDVVFLRRKREIPLTLVRDPFLREPLPLVCRACGEPAFAFHACDEAGHLTCPRCAAPCSACARVTCRSCVPAGCKACSRA
jgi:hypothetical protein